MSKDFDLGIIGVAPPRPDVRSDATEWTKEVVLDRLAAGIKIVQHTGGRIGPAGPRNGLPTFLVQLDEELAGNVAPEPVRLPPSARQIRLAEEAVEWPARFVADRRVREALHIWMLAKAIRKPWQKIAERRGWARETAKRYKDRAVYHIVIGLTEAAVPVDEGRR